MFHALLKKIAQSNQISTLIITGSLFFITASLLLKMIIEFHTIQSKYPPRIEKLQHIQFEIAQSHLWLEEYLQGDLHESYGSVRDRLEESSQALRYFRNPKKSNPLYLTDPTQITLLNTSIAILDEFIRITEERYANKEKSGVGTKIDQFYDFTFHKLINETNALIGSIKEENDSASSFFKNLQFTSLGMEAVSFLIASLIMILISRRRDETLGKLKEYNENLKKKIEIEVQKQRDQENIMMQQSRLAAMGEMIGNIAHQWRQPITVIGMSAYNIEDAYEHDDLQKEYLDKQLESIHRQVRFMSQTIEDFRNFYSPKKERQLSHVNEIVQNTLKLVEESYKAKGIQIINNSTTCDIQTYGCELSQVILVILQNAKDALSDNQINDPHIIITPTKTPHHCTIKIQDNAGGIPGEIIGKIFDPYFTTKGPEVGTGLGLYMAKTIMQKHLDGDLEVRNEEEGASFYITFDEGGE